MGEGLADEMGDASATLGMAEVPVSSYVLRVLSTSDRRLAAETGDASARTSASAFMGSPVLHAMSFAPWVPTGYLAGGYHRAYVRPQVLAVVSTVT